MTTYTQKNRPLAVTTPLGPDALLLTGFTGSEGISQLFHFGLGERSKVDAVEIYWPGWPPDRPQRIDHPAINQLHQLTEPRPTR